MVEEWKWRGVPTWYHDGMTCKDHVEMTFAKGVRRAIDFHEGDRIDDKALKALVRATAALGVSPAG